MVIEEAANVAAQTSRSRGRASGPAHVEKPQAKAAKAAAAGPVQAGAPSTDPRVLLSRERVLSTTLELLTESGLGGLTIDDVSKRSGVAKTTIYRHWRTRNALIIDACLRMTDGDEDPPDTGSLEGDLGSILTELADLLATARWSSIMPSIMDAAEREPEIAELHSRLQIWHAAPMRRALERAVERGQISPDVDINVMASALRGPLYFRRWFTREPINAPFIEFVVRGVIAAVDGGQWRRLRSHVVPHEAIKPLHGWTSKGVVTDTSCRSPTMTLVENQQTPLSAEGEAKVITLCGSTKFEAEFAEVNQQLTMDGCVVMSLGMFSLPDLPDDDWATDISDLKRRLRDLHFQKIRMADEVYIVDPGGYVGESTWREIAYAESLGKPVRYLSRERSAPTGEGPQKGSGAHPS